MFRRLIVILLAGAIACSSLACGIAGLTPAPVSMPAARAGLLPEYRFFYDALADDGDWILIEPFGWVFRPHVNFVAWRPYQSGFWAPSDIYGWTWISAESFGWATDHYGRWVYDDFQGWVWVPGLSWGPAWVSWTGDNNYVGWAPLPPAGGNWNAVPGGPYLYVPTSQLPATDMSSHVIKAADLGSDAADLAPLDNPGEHEGVKFNRGPGFEQIQRASGGLLYRVKIDQRNPLAKSGGKAGAAASSPAPSTVDSVAAMRRAAAEQARQARVIIESRQSAPPILSLIRAPRTAAEKGRARTSPETPAPPDSGR
ncbi:MAG: DUF6600 domain-containing protein [Candidatus Eiseniibacteriota bacterium]